MYTFIENNTVVLNKKNDIKIELVCQSLKTLNNMFNYQISIYNIFQKSGYDCFLIDGIPLKKSPPITRVFITEKAEIASILDVRVSDINKNVKRIIDLIIIEGEGELSLSKRTLNEKIPSINISTTKTDEFNDQYKKYEGLKNFYKKIVNDSINNSKTSPNIESQKVSDVNPNIKKISPVATESQSNSKIQQKSNFNNQSQIKPNVLKENKAVHE